MTEVVVGVCVWKRRYAEETFIVHIKYF